jgi:hypothetical protein
MVKKENRKSFTFNIPPSLYSEFSELCKQKYISCSQQLVSLVAEYVSKSK